MESTRCPGLVDGCRHRNYRMTCAEFANLWSRADGRCELCRAKNDLCIDHDSDFDKSAVRGLLCRRCNSRLGDPRSPHPERETYLAKPWYLSISGRPLPMRIRFAELSRVAIRAKAHQIVSDLVLAHLRDEEIEAPTRHDQEEIRAWLVKLAQQQHGRAAALE